MREVIRVAFNAAAILILFSWFTTSVFVQFRSRRYRWLRAYDVFKCLPFYTFFTPKAAVYDCHLLIRDKGSDGAVARWMLVDSPNRSRLHMFWNPDKKKNK